MLVVLVALVLPDLMEAIQYFHRSLLLEAVAVHGKAHQTVGQVDLRAAPLRMAQVEQRPLLQFKATMEETVVEKAEAVEALDLLVLLEERQEAEMAEQGSAQP